MEQKPEQNTPKPQHQRPSMPQMVPKAESKADLPKDFRHLVRIMDTDLDGNKSIGQALHKIKGISFMYSHAICKLAQIDTTKKAGILNDSEIAKLDDVMKNPMQYNIPSWMLNRRKDYEDGEDKHLFTSDLIYARENDIKIMKKIKSFKGIRHILGQPVRGQKTKSNFRKNKGKVMGVKRAKVAPGSAEASKDKGKKK